MNEPKLIDNFRALDDRGDFTNTNLPTDITWKRSYVIKNNQTNVIRAFHGHKNEWKLITAPTGTWKVVVFKMDEFDAPLINASHAGSVLPLMYESKIKSMPSFKTFILGSVKPQSLLIPPGYYNGFINLTADNLAIIQSSSTPEDSMKDDYRLSPYALDTAHKSIWSIDFR